MTASFEVWDVMFASWLQDPLIQKQVGGTPRMTLGEFVGNAPGTLIRMQNAATDRELTATIESWMALFQEQLKKGLESK